MNIRRFFYGFIGCLGFFTGICQTVTWQSGDRQKNIGDAISILEDKNSNFTIDRVASDSLFRQFKPSDQVILNFGFTSSSYWLYFEMDAPDDKLLLELAHTHLEKVDFYAIDEKGAMKKLSSGYSIPINQKYKKHHFQVFPVFQGKYKYFVNIGKPVQPLPVRIHDIDTYEIKTYRQRLVFGFYLGLIFFVILSNLFFYISLKNRLFLFYSGIVLVYLSYAWMVMDGFIVYFTDNIDLKFWYKNIPTFGVPLQMIYALVFLEMSKYSPKVNRYTWWLIYYFIAYAIIKFWIPETSLYAMNTLHALISFFGMCYLGYHAHKKGNRLGIYFALAYLIYFILVLTEATYVQIGTPGYIAELSFVAWATIIEAFILSFLLSKRFEWEKEESDRLRNVAQKQLLAQTLENERIVREQNTILEQRVEERTEELNNSIKNLKLTQTQLIQAEKMASLGELTAGIAHEIQNPLNFVNNFSEVSSELVDEIFEEIDKGDINEVRALTGDLKSNLEKITHHGKRAGDIVKGMLHHSRKSTGQKEMTDINALCDEYLRLAYHGLRAKDKSFNATMSTDFDPLVPKLEVVSQDLGRVILNIITNAFYAVNERSKSGEPGYEPTVIVATKKHENKVEILIRDNGSGIPSHIKDKIFQPFFTTKPTGQGTGLGLSLAYDVVNSHEGEIKVESEIGKGSVFIISLTI
jgi:signal transduction histidine kinase